MTHYASRKSGFTVIEVIIVVIIIGILATISLVVYTNVQKRAYNSAMLSAVGQFTKGLATYKIKYRKYPTVQADVTPGADSRVCLGVGYSDKDGDGTPDCGDPSYYSQVFEPFNDDLSKVMAIPTITDKSISIPMPYATGGDWTGVAFIKQSGGSDPFTVNGEPNPYFIMYMLHGDGTDCKLDVVSEKWPSDPPPVGWPNMKPSPFPYSWTNNKTTACVIALPN